MDLGSEENCSEDGLPHMPRSIPWARLPAGLVPALQATEGALHKRPDAFMYKAKTDKNPAKYWIIEVKVCRDSDPAGQQERAREQHDALERKLREVDPGAEVCYTPLLVGAGGTLYSNTVDYLEELGIKGPALRQCKKDLNLAAVKYLYTIYATKRKKEERLEHQRGHQHRRNRRR